MNHARNTGPALAFRRTVVVCLLMALVAVPRLAMANDVQDAKQLVEQPRYRFSGRGIPFGAGRETPAMVGVSIPRLPPGMQPIRI